MTVEHAAVETKQPLLTVRGLRVEFPVGRRTARRKQVVRAVDGVDFDIFPGETFALVGESGSGKSTTARGILRLVDVAQGSVVLDGVDVTALSRSELRTARRHMQMVFQDPYSSLDPSHTVGDAIAEPLEVHTDLSDEDRRRKVGRLLEQVGLRAEHADRYPYEFSGGQRQRIAIARAIAVEPKLVIADEAVSALDVSTQNQVIALLEQLSAELGIAYLFIAHDLAVVRHIAHTTAVMYLGRIVEWGPTERLFTEPAHPYTQALLSAVPVPDPARQRRRERIRLSGELPDPANPPTGCAFSTRCPLVMPVCRESRPAVTEVAGGGQVACHLHSSEQRPASEDVPV
ncbi:peptide/nickel transport system ATP-binding protein/oligopeptide transport system ATP-binding protein [Rhodococcus rhodochrous J45]|uniref:Peptide/nickel transport system ATP-binding protein/oligopeptide transport system ATP-binding protein n=1 Tax=Rhodococcus rhodochrous J45 TaxID=935266 RepID=A0A562ET03_RHORH|nr:oligopeptide/dipeptide ABC transporter ATP-binding protein [Rhodococcus rhodochrous]TWH25082.1 peptide/nickel transport system ATP-binding protein/oligopeptide transport system ATP-binding protein [Rhodococcus rhodochrous J45]